ncbi:MAG: hypothetical protein WKG06_39410 [Segetibacter sp.]
MLTKKLLTLAKKQTGKKYFPSPYIKSTDKLTLLALLITFLLVGCRKECIDNDKHNQYLVSSTKIGDFTKEQLDAGYNNKTELAYLNELNKYSISVYKIIYKTKFINDSDIQASGCIIIPQNSPAPAMISMQHGDILTAENLAPSYYNPMFFKR